MILKLPRGAGAHVSLPPSSTDDANMLASPAWGLLVNTRYRCFLPSSLPLTVFEPERGTRRPLRHCGAKSAGARISHNSVSGPVRVSKENRGGSDSGDISVKWGGQENRAAPQAGAPSIPTPDEPPRRSRGNAAHHVDPRGGAARGSVHVARRVGAWPGPVTGVPSPTGLRLGTSPSRGAAGLPATRYGRE